MPGQFSSTSSQRRDLYAYSLIWGSLTFLAGVGTTLVTLPEKLRIEQTPSWKVATWVWLNAHGIPIAEQAVTGSVLQTGNVDFIGPNPKLHLLRVIPLFLATIAAVMVVNSLRGARDDTELAEYTVFAGGGYVFAGLIAIVLSDARPGVILVLGLMAVLGLAAYFGSRVANSLPIPVVAITSLSGLVGIGLLVLLGAGAVLTVAIPLGKYAFAGSVSGALAVWVGKNIDL